MEDNSPSIENIRSAIRYNTNNLPINLICKEFYDIPARLSNVSLGGFQILCSHYAAQQLSLTKYSADDQNSEAINITIEILDKDDSKTFELSCKVAYIHEDHSPNDYCSDAVGLEAMITNPENRQALSRFIEENT